MNLQTKKILYIDLQRKLAEVKSDANLKKYIGGVGIGLKLLSENQDRDPVVFSIGPLNGFFPFCSKTSIVLNDNGTIEDTYIGGSFGSRMQFAGIDSIVLTGRSRIPLTLEIEDESVTFREAETDLGTIGLPGKRSILYFDKNSQELLVDRYFSSPEKFLERKFLEKNIYNVVVTGTKVYDIPDSEKYDVLYNKILNQKDNLTVTSDSFPSCVGCPMGCQKSKIGEVGGNVLAHSLVACSYAEKIFTDVGNVFSCLNILGYDYTHEDIENFPEQIRKIMETLS
ncbi:MAG: hypothetical protein ACD_22C00100G0015 [uncultured bacterium]|nr:MAG: hypothetical protein ACD_22C00100G0015 [uncultured bacterium]